MGRADLLSRSEAIAEKKTVNGIVIAACAQRYSPRYTTHTLQLAALSSCLCLTLCVCVCISQRHQKVFCINSRFMHSMFAEVPHSFGGKKKEREFASSAPAATSASTSVAGRHVDSGSGSNN